MNAMYGFEKECLEKYTKNAFNKCSDVFNSLPLGHILNNKILVVHGGIFTDPNLTIPNIQSENRYRQPPETGPINDLLWSDPMEQKGLAPSPRGVTRTFGPDITESFLKRNNLDFVIRSHQVQEKGFCEMHDGKCITVFSSPNYIGQMQNLGAIIQLDFDNDFKLIKKTYQQFKAKPIPQKYPPMKYASFG